MKTESTKRNGQFWKNVMIGGVPGILIGSLGTGVATSAFAQTNEDPVSELSPLPIAEINDDMSFGEAFAAARAQVGPGGVFEWRGNVYNTYNADEWNAMSPEDRAEFADRLSETPIEIEVEDNVTDNGGSNETVIQAEPATDNNQEHEAEIVGEVDMQVEEVGVVVMEDGSEVILATGQMDGHFMVLTDVDSDGAIDAMAVDYNDNGEVDQNEMIDDADLTVGDVLLLAENNIADNPADDLYAGTPDYINDADTSAFA